MKEDIKRNIERNIKENIAVKERLLSQKEKIEQIAEEIIKTYGNNGKILICGNGGSAADAQHFAAELVGRFKKERRALPAIALTTDTSTLTAIGNDHGFYKIFSRQIEALGAEGDLLIGISTSGNSENVIAAAKEAKKKGMKTLCLLGKDGGSLKDIADLSLVINSDNTPRIQESHILIIHILCDIIEQEVCNDENFRND